MALSFAQEINKQATKRYTTKDNRHTFVLQRVDTNSLLISDLEVQDIESLGNSVDEILDDKQLETDIKKGIKLLKKSKLSSKFIQKATRHNKEIVLKGCVGAVNENGDVEQIVWVDKNALEIHPDYGEVNIEFLDPELIKELGKAIKDIGRPAVEGKDISTFPQE